MTADPFSASEDPTCPASPRPPAGACCPETPPATFITSQRLWFRAPGPADAALINIWRNDPRVRRTTTPCFPCTQEAVEKWIATRNPWDHGVANTHITLMFGLKGTEEAIGYSGVFAIEWVHRRGTFGLALGPAHWNQGYGREATARMAQYAFEELNLHRVDLHVQASNQSGIRAYRANGFEHEGTLRQSDWVDGRREDVHVMGLLAEEWFALQRPAS